MVTKVMFVVCKEHESLGPPGWFHWSFVTLVETEDGRMFMPVNVNRTITVEESRAYAKQMQDWLNGETDVSGENYSELSADEREYYPKVL